jgi:hypothetical protein
MVKAKTAAHGLRQRTVATDRRPHAGRAGGNGSVESIPGATSEEIEQLWRDQAPEMANLKREIRKNVGLEDPDPDDPARVRQLRAIALVLADRARIQLRDGFNATGAELAAVQDLAAEAKDVAARKRTRR